MLFLFISSYFKQFFTIPVDNENVRLRLALAIPIGVLITVPNYAIEILPLVADKAIKDLSKQSQKAIYLLSRLRITSLSFI